MGRTRLTLLLALLCMAAACNEAHLTGSTDREFNQSLMDMMKTHRVADAQRFGRDLELARAKLGNDFVRGKMVGMNFDEGRKYLDQAVKPSDP